MGHENRPVFQDLNKPAHLQIYDCALDSVDIGLGENGELFCVIRDEHLPNLAHKKAVSLEGFEAQLQVEEHLGGAIRLLFKPVDFVALKKLFT